ncbi:uncharacterized protein LOC130940609 [Arachis stenosperma]|uniref:uncharacterized protein LOC130940609 n=1 Tax=Arachis stenosperma TaxID=217475 RepID=UPI0025ABBC96|nr:uncharacterized protein LOC130940609 [Arachis stenosperma]
MASPANPPTQSMVSTETIQKAIDALFKWRKSNSTAKPQKLFDNDEEFIYLVLTLKKIPQKDHTNVTPLKIPLPYTLISPSSETCLIVDDRPKSGLTKAQAQSKIQAEKVAVSKVLKLSKLASDYKPFEAKRKLCDSYDLFFADRRVVPLLPRLLGKQFLKKKKVPVPLDLKKGNWKEQVDKAYSSALFSVGNGTCCVVRVAKVAMAREEVVANVTAAIEGIVDAVPRKWKNVRSFHVKLLESLALPVYQAVPDVRLRIEGGDSEGEAMEKEELKKKRKKKKGRYMDSDLGEDHSKDELGSDDFEHADNDNGRDLVSLKMKKGDQVKNGALSGLSNVKRETKKRGLVQWNGADMAKKVKH